jgi:hypothetical protein
MFTCPCCGFRTLDRPPGSFEICPICYWEDDDVQLAFPDLSGGANACSLIDSQQNFVHIGACEQRFKGDVRPPTGSDRLDPDWRPLDTNRDEFLQWATRDDHELWQLVKDRESLCLYYWSPTYWLLEAPP